MTAGAATSINNKTAAETATLSFTINKSDRKMADGWMEPKQHQCSMLVIFALTHRETERSSGVLA